jgi:hypothetical protein
VIEGHLTVASTPSLGAHTFLASRRQQGESIIEAELHEALQHTADIDANATRNRPCQLINEQKSGLHRRAT